MQPGFNEAKLSVQAAIATLDAAGLVLNAFNKQKSSQTVGHIVVDSRKVATGDIYIAFKGSNFDAHDALSEVATKQPALVIIEDESKRPIDFSGAVLVVASGRRAWSLLSSEAYGRPQEQLTLIGVTGTNGKTSTVWHLRHLFAQAGVEVLSIGTLGAWLGDVLEPTTHTTPDPPVLFSLFRRAVDAGIKHVVMEVSSHALHQEKLAPLSFAAAAFTSFSRDHLDLHVNMKAYFQEKLRLFSELSTAKTRFYFSSSLGPMLKHLYGFANYSEVYGFEAAKCAQQFGFDYYTDVKVLQTSSIGSECAFERRDGSALQKVVPVVGAFAVENFLAAALIMSQSLDIPLQAVDGSKVKQVPGRLEVVQTDRDGSPLIVVDYAHTPDALQKALEVLRPLTRGKLWVVFGCGGDRDPGKRPIMGDIAVRLADQVLVTSDNPRYEDASSIISDIMKGVGPDLSGRVQSITDRAAAITQAVRTASSDDVVLIAGKGHEDYMDIKGVKTAFDDRLVAALALQDRQ